MANDCIVVGLMVARLSLRRRIRRLVSKRGWDSFDVEDRSILPPSDLLIVDGDRLDEIRESVPVVVLTYGGGMRYHSPSQVDVRAIVDRDDLDEAFLEAVHEVATGHGWISPTLVRPLLRRAPSMETTPHRPVRTSGLAPHLTAREHEVLSLVSQGMNNSEISGALYIAESTVKFHVSNILHKTGCRDRSQLAARRSVAG
ncbi:LuxR C-terminal-related transcriptional regulator [Streptomyces sp. NPDC051578]|uniref:helix-turn-helix transcriptional regulator n=1 Tax=Streptomyces sp. NPDC051578 TaxID=3365662 RepID=UPI0037AE4C03